MQFRFLPGCVFLLFCCWASMARPAFAEKIIFPETSIGSIHLNESDRTPTQRHVSMDAKGAIDVPAGKSVTIIFADEKAGAIEVLSQQKANHLITGINLQYSGASDNDLRSIAKFKNLVELRLTDCDVSDECLAQVSLLPNLMNIECAGSYVTAKGVMKLLRMTHLELLNASSNNLTGLDLSELSKLGALRELRLSRTNIDDSVLKSMKPPATLRRLWVDHNTGITDAGLPSLERASGLTWLNVSQTGVSMKGVSALQKLKNLATLRVSYSAFSPKDRAVLVSSLSKCLVENGDVKFESDKLFSPLH